MKPKTFVFATVLCLITAGVCFAQEAHMGTWKLNEAKSKIPAGANKNHTVIYEAAGADTKIIVDGTDSTGTATHNEWTGKFDGKDYPLVGDPTADSRAYSVVNPKTLSMTIKKGGKVVVTGKIVVSDNGKSRTVTTTGTNADGKSFKTVAVYDKQ